MFQGSFRAMLLSNCVTVKANEDALGTKYHEKVVISNIFILLVITDVCIFVCFDRQHSSVDRYTMIDTSAVLTATPCIKCLVVNKTFEHIVNCLAHHSLAPLKSASLVTLRIIGVIIDEAVHTVFVVFVIGYIQFTLDT